MPLVRGMCRTEVEVVAENCAVVEDGRRHEGGILSYRAARLREARVCQSDVAAVAVVVVIVMLDRTGRWWCGFLVMNWKDGAGDAGQ